MKSVRGIRTCYNHQQNANERLAMWWGYYGRNRDGKSRWRTSWGSNNVVPLDQDPETRIDPNMSQAEIDARIRLRIQKRAQQRREFVNSLVSYLIINAALWVFSGTFSHMMIFFPWPIFVTFFWGVKVALQGWQVYQNSGAALARREMSIRREVELEKARLGITDDYEKPKRALRLSDDGELIPVDEYDDQQEAAEVNKSKHSE